MVERLLVDGVGGEVEREESIVVISDTESNSPARGGEGRRSWSSPGRLGRGEEEPLVGQQLRCLRELQDAVAVAALSTAGGSGATGPDTAARWLREVARAMPADAAQLAKVKCVTKAVAKKYETVILDVVKDYRGEGGVQEVVEEEEGDDMANISLNITTSDSQELAGEGDEAADEAMATLTAILPEVDPAFLRTKARELAGDQARVEEFLASCLERRVSLPSRKERERSEETRREVLAVRRLRPSEFLAEFDDPHAHFRQAAAAVGAAYREQALYYLLRHFPSHPQDLVEQVLAKHNGHFVPSIEEIKATRPGKGKVRVGVARPKKPEAMDLDFLKEYVYYKLEPKIRKLQERALEKRQKVIKAAKASGALFECLCCYDSECLLAEVAMCPAGCLLCRECVRRGAGVAIGDAKTVIECLAGCGQAMDDDVVRAALPANTFERLQQRRQMEEVEAAGLEDLERCPACSYATIMPDAGVRVLVCGNPQCGKQTCRLCKEVGAQHV